MKRLLAILILAAMLLMVTACSTVPGNIWPFNQTAHKQSEEYGVYLMQTLGGGYFTEEIGSFVWKGQYQADSSAPNESVKLETINGVDVSVEYDCSYTASSGDTRYYYVSTDGKVECVYRADDMSLISIKLDEQDMSAFADMGLEEYDQYIRAYVSQYYTENWQDLSLSCLTHYFVVNTDYLARHVDHDFLTEFADNMTLDTREFRYTKEYCGYQTTDEVRVLMSFKEKSIRIWFNYHKFDSLDVTIDNDAINTAISTFLNSYLQEGVVLEGYEQLAAKLMYSNDNLVCRMDLNVVFARGEEREERDVSFIVDIPDET